MNEIEQKLKASLFHNDRTARASQYDRDSHDHGQPRGQQYLTRSQGQLLGLPGRELHDQLRSRGQDGERQPHLSRGQGGQRQPHLTRSHGQSSPTGLLHKELSYAIVGTAIEVHRHIGPGQLEATYERALCKELARRGIEHRSQVPLEMSFKGDVVGEFYADLIVEDKVIVELKAVAAVHYVHRMQVLSYLRASGLRLGLLINFNVPVLSRAVIRVVL